MAPDGLTGFEKLIPYVNEVTLPTGVPKALNQLPATTQVDPFQVAPYPVFVEGDKASGGFAGTVQVWPSTDVQIVCPFQAPIATNCVPFHATELPIFTED